MTGLKRVRPLCLIVSVVLLAALALPAAGIAAASTQTYTEENQQAFESQLQKGEIATAVFNRKVRSLRITTKNGQYFLYHYPKKGSPALESALTAKHVTFTVLKKAEAEKEVKKKSTKHKLRYIVGGIAIVVILIVGVVLLVNRRRKSAE
jgi:hypothetical protein